MTPARVSRGQTAGRAMLFDAAIRRDMSKYEIITRCVMCSLSKAHCIKIRRQSLSPPSSARIRCTKWHC